MKTARRHRISTAGKILPPLDVRHDKHLGAFKQRIQKGPLTIVLVYADWCGHCHTMMPHFDEAAKSTERSIQAVKINEQMLPAVNNFVNKSVNKSAKPINVEGYPSIMLVDTAGNKVADVPTKRDTNVMKSLMAKSGSIAKQAGLNGSNPEDVVNSVVKNNIVSSNANTGNARNTGNKNKKKKNNLMAEVGVEESGLAEEATASPKNFDVGEDELTGNLSPAAPINQLSKPASPKKLNIAASMAPSPTTGFSAEYEAAPNKQSARKNSNKSMEDEARIVTSLAAPLSPPLNDGDMEASVGASGMPETEGSESISNSLEPAEKVSGGGCGCGGPPVPRYGGSLMGSLARTTYTLAPAAILLATAASVMRGKTHKHKKSGKKTRRNRRR
jgi:thiol-disulfide isomerase/thioredoxin